MTFTDAIMVMTFTDIIMVVTFTDVIMVVHQRKCPKKCKQQILSFFQTDEQTRKKSIFHISDLYLIVETMLIYIAFKSREVSKPML